MHHAEHLPAVSHLHPRIGPVRQSYPGVTGQAAETLRAPAACPETAGLLGSKDGALGYFMSFLLLLEQMTTNLMA